MTSILVQTAPLAWPSHTMVLPYRVSGLIGLQSKDQVLNGPVLVMGVPSDPIVPAVGPILAGVV